MAAGRLGGDDDEEEEEVGVLLYYKYAPVPDVSALSHFYESNCTSLALLGRVRIAPHGVNVTVGGKMSSLRQHISAISSNALFQGTDFKLASCPPPSDVLLTHESGFTSLSIRIVKELVTFSSHPLSAPPTIFNAGKHLSASEFHSFLQPDESGSIDQEEKLVLLDARNIYETRIGRFEAPNIETLDPKIRQYSDLSHWIDCYSHQLQGKTVLMYCTGGIRCEMASAYIRSKGAGFENVYQLYGGIQRYMEQFPDGGFFKGKNFVFDHRVSVGRIDGCTIGSCQLCTCPFDDYSARCRCRHCRMLVLVCYDCQNPAGMYCCEICEKRCKDLEKTAQSVSTLSLSDDGAMPNCTNFPMQLNRELGDVFRRKLRILCLHGFRQNASGFRGRTASLAKKLKTLVEFVFVDAPHELPFVYQFRSSSSAKKLDAEPDCSSNFDKCRKRFAWLIESNKDLSEINSCCMAEGPFDSLQFRRQTEGLEKSLSYLNRVVSEMGPFDGVLGFSQGATMAALFCSSQRQEEAGLRFRFAILCSGYAVNSLGVVKNSINCPSLHIFGGGEGKDRQIGRNESIELASLFDEDCAVLIEHDAGHIIPTWLPYVDTVKGFLQRFL